jgi:hypothetical protein
LFFPLPFRFFITLFALNFLPILYVLGLTKHGTVIVKQSVHSFPKFLKSHLNFSTSIEYICRKVIVSREYFSINAQKIEAFL